MIATALIGLALAGGHGQACTANQHPFFCHPEQQQTVVCTPGPVPYCQREPITVVCTPGPHPRCWQVATPSTPARP